MGSQIVLYVIKTKCTLNTTGCYSFAKEMSLYLSSRMYVCVQEALARWRYFGPQSVCPDSPAPNNKEKGLSETETSATVSVYRKRVNHLNNSVVTIVLTLLFL